MSNYLIVKGFDFAVPTNATITGIEVKVERKEGAAYYMGLRDNSVRMVKGGAVVGNDKALTTAWSNTETIVTYGTDSDLWGTTWTPSEINDPDFGVAISVKGSGTQGTETAYIDNAMVTIYYAQ